MVESIIFFAFHSSGVMSRIFPILYEVTSCFAFSRPADDVNNVLHGALLVTAFRRSDLPVRRQDAQRLYKKKKRTRERKKKKLKVVVLTTPSPCQQTVHCAAVSPRVCNIGRVLHAPPVRAEIVLRYRQVAISRK